MKKLPLCFAASARRRHVCRHRRPPRPCRRTSSNTASTFEKFPATQGQGSESERLRKLFDLFWESRCTPPRSIATYVGYPGLDDRWSDQSPESSTSAATSTG